MYSTKDPRYVDQAVLYIYRFNMYAEFRRPL